MIAHRRHFAPRSRRRLRTACRALLGPLGLTLLVATAAAPAAGSDADRSAPPALRADEVWITIAPDAFEAAGRLFPRGADGESLPRVDEAEGVVLTLVPRAAIPVIAEAIHRDLGRCGGFFAHESLEEARAALDRVRSPLRPDTVLPFVIDQPAWVAALAGAVEENQLFTTIDWLSTQYLNRYHAHPTGAAAAQWIRDAWEGYAAGRPEITSELFFHPGITPQPSVILTIPGSTLPDEVVVLGGHEDSARSGCFSDPNCVAPGADDNASGIAVLTEVIRVAMAADFHPHRTVQFMAYAAEEVGLDGSDHIAATYFAAGTNVVAVLQMGMTDYHGSVEDMAIITDHSDPELNVFVEDLVDTYQPTLVWTTDICGYGCSDHASWDSRGYRASFAFESQFGERNPFIHTSNDTLANLGNSTAHAARFARLAAAFLVETAIDGPTMPFSDGFESGDTSAWTSTVP